MIFAGFHRFERPPAGRADSVKEVIGVEPCQEFRLGFGRDVIGAARGIVSGVDAGFADVDFEPRIVFPEQLSKGGDLFAVIAVWLRVRTFSVFADGPGRFRKCVPAPELLVDMDADPVHFAGQSGGQNRLRPAEVEQSRFNLNRCLRVELSDPFRRRADQRHIVFPITGKIVRRDGVAVKILLVGQGPDGN